MNNIRQVNYLQNELDTLEQDNCIEIIKECIHSGENLKTLSSFIDYYRFIAFFNEDVLHASLLTSNNKKCELSICTELISLENIIAAKDKDIVLHIIKYFLNQCLQTTIREIEVEEQLAHGMEVIHNFSI